MKSLTNAKEIKINGKAVKQIKDVAKDSVIWQSNANPVINDTFIGNGESLYFAPAAESVQRAIVRGTCSLSTDTATPETPATMSCNNGEMQYVDGVLTISGSPSTFDYNESRLNPVDLFGWGYADEQNVLTGVITRKVQVSAMRASWDWMQQSISGANYFALPKASYPLLVCTHFHQVATATPANVGEWCEGSGDYLLFNYDGANDNLADFEDYLEDCYAANEAVICLTKRFVDITENETAFPCVSVKGLNSFKYVANDDSNVYLKYRAVYPRNNAFWVQSTDGTSSWSFWTYSGHYPTGCTPDTKTSLGNDITEFAYFGEISTIQELTSNNIKRVWFPKSWCKAPQNSDNIKSTLQNIYCGGSEISGKSPKVRAFGCNAYFKWSVDGQTWGGNLNDILFPSKKVNSVFGDLTKLDSLLQSDCHPFSVSVNNVVHLIILSGQWCKAQGYTIPTSSPADFIYVPATLINSYKTYKGSNPSGGTGYQLFKHRIFPIPDCWL